MCRVGVHLGLKKQLLLVLCLFDSMSVIFCGESSFAWCYHGPSCNAYTWPARVKKCSGSRQSPISIWSGSARPDSSLTPFTFTNFNNRAALTKIENTGKTVKVTLASGVAVSRGGLSEPYHSLQFHLHWGNRASVSGSEHTVDGKRYPMELHIVNIKASHKGNVAHAVADSKGLAVLGFFIDGIYNGEPNKPDAWYTLTNYLTKIKKSGTSFSMAPGISLDDLLVGVDRSKYYRYLGSLTTPNCNEAVVWTVFKDPVKISTNLIDLFSSSVYVTGSTSTFITNNYRYLQPQQPVTTQPDARIKTGIKGYSKLYPLLLKLEKTDKQEDQ